MKLISSRRHARIFSWSTATLITALAAACATSPTGRKQLMLVPEQQVDQSGIQAFQELKQQTPVVTDPRLDAYVSCVVKPLTEAAQGETDVKQWEVDVFNTNEVNAFALPGGKIGVFKGLLPVANTPDQLATVIGHEIGHVIAKHGAERMSNALVEQGGLAVVNAFISGSASPMQSQLIMGALGLGTQVGYVLPHSRTQESEADVIGLRLMAQAGFDPRQSIELWKHMSAAAGGNAPPEFLSDHPADQARIENLQSHLPEAEKMAEQAHQAGRNPHCTPPT